MALDYTRYISQRGLASTDRSGSLMKIKLDENLPLRPAPTLQRAGHDVDTVLQEGLGGKADHDAWLAAQAENRF